ncbi:MAG: hypothetical protein JWL60_2577, partial [Gemmatimonadetes bacterium]|nr:hypothetical protein [Gemmatimonadota bacterium]
TPEVARVIDTAARDPHAALNGTKR